MGETIYEESVNFLAPKVGQDIKQKSAGQGAAQQIVAGSKPPDLKPFFTLQGEGGGAPAAPRPLPGDYSLQNPGAAEMQWDPSQWEQPFGAEAFNQQNQNLFYTPGVGELGTAAMIPGIQAPGAGQMFQQQSLPGAAAHMGAGNMSAQAFQDYQQNAAADPGMGRFYDNAGRKALESINQNAAARGVYGSSAALSQGQEALTDLAADRARHEADYNLRRLGLGGQLAGAAERSQLDWFGRGGDLAMDAERLGLGRQQTALDALGQLDETALKRLGLGMDAATRAGDERLGRLSGATRAAEGAQDARQERIFGVSDRVSGNAGMFSETAGQAGIEILLQDQAFVDAVNQYVATGDVTALKDLERRGGQYMDAVNIGMGLVTAPGDSAAGKLFD